MQSLPKAERRVRYALGVHLLQRAVLEWTGPGVHVEPPETFYPLGPEISEHWFRADGVSDLSEIVTPRTLLVHLYASVRVEKKMARVDPAWLRSHRDSELFSALGVRVLDELGW
jgi:hypothetical protein